MAPARANHDLVRTRRDPAIERHDVCPGVKGVTLNRGRGGCRPVEAVAKQDSKRPGGGWSEADGVGSVRQAKCVGTRAPNANRVFAVDDAVLLSSLEEHCQIIPGDFRVRGLSRARCTGCRQDFGTDSQYVRDVLEIETVEPSGWDSGSWTDRAAEWRFIAGRVSTRPCAIR